MLCLEDGRYAFNNLIKAGDVAVETDDELEFETERNGNVGVVCLKYFNHACALSGGTRSILNTKMLKSSGIQFSNEEYTHQLY